MILLCARPRRSYLVHLMHAGKWEQWVKNRIFFTQYAIRKRASSAELHKSAIVSNYCLRSLILYSTRGRGAPVGAPIPARQVLASSPTRYDLHQIDHRCRLESPLRWCRRRICRFEFSERERVGYFQLKTSISLSVSQSQITVIIMLI